MADRFSDVLVVGAGVSGMVAAGFLARAGHRVTVVDAASGGPAGLLILTAPGLEVLAELGAGPRLLALPGARKWNGLELVARNAAAVSVDRCELVALPRAAAVELLFEHAMSMGAVVIGGFTATVPIWENRRVSGVRCRDRAGKTFELGARVVIDASGPGSFLAVALGQLLPRRGRARGRFFAVLDAAAFGKPRLSVAGESWLLALPGDPPLACGLVPCPETTPAADEADVQTVVETHLGPGFRVSRAELLPARVGSVHRAAAGEGWVAVGEAAGCGAPGLPGVTSAGVLVAASAAWEIDLALRKGKRVTGSALGATVTMNRQKVHLERLTERALGRALRLGMLEEVAGTPGRAAVLAELLAGRWNEPTGRLRRMAFLWRLDRRSRKRAAQTRAG